MLFGLLLDYLHSSIQNPHLNVLFEYGVCEPSIEHVSAVLAGGELLLMGCKVGLPIFQMDALVLPGGPFLHSTRWWDMQHSLTPSHTLQGRNMCVSKHATVCVYWNCLRNAVFIVDFLRANGSQDYIESAIPAQSLLAHFFICAHQHAHTLLYRNWQPDTPLLI